MWTDFLIINGLFFWSPKTMSFLVDSDNEEKKCIKGTYEIAKKTCKKKMSNKEVSMKIFLMDNKCYNITDFV